MELLECQLNQLQQLLNDLPCTKKHIAVTKWHQALGEPHSMSLAFPGLRKCLSLRQEGL